MKITKTTVKNVITDAIKRDLANYEAHRAIIEALTPLDGERLTGHVLGKRFEKKHNLTIEWSRSMVHIERDSRSHLIAYTSNATIDIEKVKECDACHGRAALERIEKLKALDIDSVTKTFREMEKAFNKLRTLFWSVESFNLGSFNNPAYYELLKMVQGDAEEKHVKLSDFYFIRQRGEG